MEGAGEAGLKEISPRVRPDSHRAKMDSHGTTAATTQAPESRLGTVAHLSHLPALGPWRSPRTSLPSHVKIKITLLSSLDCL